MKLSCKALALSSALLWAGAILFCGIAHLIWPSYGGALLEFAASIYPGYNPSGGASSVLVGTLYALLDAGIGGAIFACLYNYFAA
ncbi:MAG: hypothetical protein KGO96_02720 [Elusimicrobia bacterium]|nr:hypothetical protein [Elusimicrobiota bacterium]MDE2237957.1 hypothetical protein [Elusimicrobiota bacterium]MDE2424806.1 hypothetical protein [Elusimicrobiota bacterium]